MKERPSCPPWGPCCSNNFSFKQSVGESKGRWLKMLLPSINTFVHELVNKSCVCTQRLFHSKNRHEGRKRIKRENVFMDCVKSHYESLLVFNNTGSKVTSWLTPSVHKWKSQLRGSDVKRWIYHREVWNDANVDANVGMLCLKQFVLNSLKSHLQFENKACHSSIPVKQIE